MKARKAISPVISTVIIVAVAIAISVAVAFWMGGLVGPMTPVGELKVDQANTVMTADPSTGEVRLTLAARAAKSTIYIEKVELVGYGTMNPDGFNLPYELDPATGEQSLNFTITLDPTVALNMIGNTESVKIFVKDQQTPYVLTITVKRA